MQPVNQIQAVVYNTLRANSDIFTDMSAEDILASIAEVLEVALKNPDDLTLEENEYDAVMRKAFESFQATGGVDLSQVHLGAFKEGEGYEPVNNQLTVGQNYFVFTPTFGFLGTLVSFNELGYQLANVVWVGHAGDVDKMVAKGSLSAAAPLKSLGFYTWGNTIAMTTWNHDLPTKSVTD